MFNPLTKHPKELEFCNTYFGIDPVDCDNYGYNNQPVNETDIYVITFNEPDFVRYQIKTLRKFFKDPFNLIIVDNNNWLHPEGSAEVLNICMEEGVIYLKAPDNHYQGKDFFDPTLKLGTTLSWIFANCVKKRSPKYFGFLDQDCFLIKDFRIVPILDKVGMYGLVSHGVNDSWNLHVTFNFFRFNFVSHLLLDFRAGWENHLDTGGKNWDILYKDYSYKDYELKNVAYRYAKYDVEPKSNRNLYEIAEETWYHMGGSSHDKILGTGIFKFAFTMGFLNSRL